MFEPMTRISFFIGSWLCILLICSDHTCGQAGNSDTKNLQNFKVPENQKSKILGLVTAGFTAPNQVCTNTPFQIVNTSSGATNYYWSFCEANSSSVAAE
jgi:hypothetical protein